MDIVGNVKSAYDLAKGLYADVKDARLQGAVSELLTKLNDVLFQLGDIRMTSLSLQEENNRLRRENDELKYWDNQKKQHVLKQLGTGGFVYVQQNASNEAGGEINKSGYLCANCYDQQRKSILQFVRQISSGTHWTCPFCKAEIVDTSTSQTGEVWTGSPRRNWDGFV